MLELAALSAHWDQGGYVCVVCRFVDPSDPSKLFLAQPTETVSQRPEAPKYAANFGVDEAYESL